MFALMFVPVSNLKAMETVGVNGHAPVQPSVEAISPFALPQIETIARSNVESTTEIIDRGKEHYDAGRFAEAVEDWQEAVDIYSAVRNRLNQAKVLSYLSLAYQKQGLWEDAEKAIEQSLALLTSQDITATESKRRRVRALALNNQGLLFLAVGKAEDALHVWETAETDYQALGEDDAVAGVRVNQALAWSAMGHYPRSCNLLLETMGVEGLSCDDLDPSKLQNDNTQQDETETPLKQIEEIFAQQPNLSLKATGLRSLGNVLRTIGLVKESEFILKESLAVAEELNSSEDIAKSKFDLGNTYQALAKRYQNFNETEEAKGYREESLKSYMEATQKGSDAIALSALTNQLSLWLDDDINKSIEEEELARQEEERARQEAKALLPKIERLLNSVPVSQTSVKAKINLGCTLLGCDRLLKSEREDNLLVDLSQIDDWLSTAVEEAKELRGDRGDRLISYALGTKAKLYEYQLVSTPVKQSKNNPFSKGGDRNYSQAIELTQEALNLAEKSNAPDIAYQWQWQMGRLIEAEPELKNSSKIPAPDALPYYSKSLKILKTLRDDMASLNSDIQFNFRDRVEPVYRQYVDLLLRPKDPPHEKLEKARQTIEDLQLAEIDNFFQNACAKASDVKIDDLDSHAAVIYPIILKDKLEVIVKLPGENNLIYHVNDDVSEKDIDREVLSLQKKLINASTSLDKIKNQSNTLYKWLIQPFINELDVYSRQEDSHIKNLIFVLDGSLRNIPMAILYNKDQGEYLVERYAIAITPGLQLLDSETLEYKKNNALISGASDAPSFGSKPLPYVIYELQQISTVIPNKKKLMEEDFIKKNIQEAIKFNSFNIVHIATHGTFSSNPDKTFILDWNEPIQVKELNRLLQGNNDNNGNQENLIQLLVLSACKTATGDKRAALGLAGVAIRAGARSTVASLWSVNDKSTAKFMELFYEKLNDANTTSEALRQTQMFFLNPGTDRNDDYHKPYHWAAFTLVGNWNFKLF